MPCTVWVPAGASKAPVKSSAKSPELYLKQPARRAKTACQARKNSPYSSRNGAGQDGSRAAVPSAPQEKKKLNYSGAQRREFWRKNAGKLTKKQPEKVKNTAGNAPKSYQKAKKIQPNAPGLEKKQ